MNPRDVSHPCPRLFRLALAVVWCCTVLACTGNPTPQLRPQEEGLRLLGVEGDRLILVTVDTGEVQELARSPLLRDVSALAYDSKNELAYAIADASSAPLLLRISPQSGEVMAVRRIELPPLSTETADAMAFDPESGQLMIAAGNKGLSNYLLSVDPGSGVATRAGRIRETPQGEFDSLVLSRGILYATDVISEETYFFRGSARTDDGFAVQPLGKVTGKITDLAADARSGKLFAAQDGHLVTLNIHGELSVLVQPHAPALTALTVISSGAMLFADGFESGDLASWSEMGQN